MKFDMEFSKHSDMKFDVYASKHSATYNGRIGDTDFWSRPTVFIAKGTAGNMAKYFYGYIEELCTSGEWEYTYLPEMQIDTKDLDKWLSELD